MSQAASSPVASSALTAPTVFRRSPAAQVGSSLGAAAGAILFGGFAGAIFSGLVTPDMAPRILFGGMVSFFAVLMGASSVAAFRRGRDTRVAEIGPNGVWTPEMGLVPWHGLAQVRLESTGGPAGPRGARIRRYRRLGLIPLDQARRPRSAAGLALLMTQAYLGLVRRMAPSANLGDVHLAPFGINETELPKDFDRLVEMARGYVEIVDAAQRPG